MWHNRNVRTFSFEHNLIGYGEGILWMLTIDYDLRRGPRHYNITIALFILFFKDTLISVFPAYSSSDSG